MKDIFISDNVTVKEHLWSVLGDHIAIDSGFYCGTRLILNSYIHISSNVTVVGGSESTLNLEDFTFISAGSHIVCASDSVNCLIGPTIPKEYRPETREGIIHFEAFSGTFSGAVITPGVTLALGSIVAANSTLLENTEPWIIYAGNPAKPIRTRDKSKILKDAKTLTGLDYENI